MSAQTELIHSTNAMEPSRLASDRGQVGLHDDPQPILLNCDAEFEFRTKTRPSSSSSPPPADPDSCDGGHLSRPSATSYTLTTHDTTLREARRVSFADENKLDGKGQITMDQITGKLGLTDGATTGEIFSMEHKFYIKDDKGRKVGECFLLRSSSNPFFYLALDGSSSDLAVRGMRQQNLNNATDCYWTYEYYKKGSKSDYILLRYYGDHFGNPSKAPYYLIIKENEDKKSFTLTIGPHKQAMQRGVLAPIFP